MQNLVTRFMNDESGATAIEYGLLAALIGVGIIGATKGVQQGLDTKFTLVKTELDAAGTN